MSILLGILKCGSANSILFEIQTQVSLILKFGIWSLIDEATKNEIFLLYFEVKDFKIEEHLDSN